MTLRRWLTAALACVAAAAAYTAQYTTLGPNTENELAYAPSDDGRHCVLVEPVEGGKCRVYVDGVAGPAYDNISKVRAVMSPDGKRWACYFTDNEYASFLVLDGRRLANTGWVVDDLMKFSPDSKHFVYVTGGSRWNVVLDGAVVKAFDAEVCPVNELQFSPDGRLGFLAEAGGGVTCYVDGQAGPKFDNAFSLSFSPDGKRYCYVGRSEGEIDQVVVDGRPGPKQRTIWAGPLFSPDGRHVAYSGDDSAGQRVYYDGKPGLYHAEVKEVAFSGDGTAFGYLALERDTWKVFRDWTPLHVFGDGSEPSRLILDRTGVNVAYVLENGGQYLVMRNAEMGPVHDLQVEHLVLSPDGTRAAYVVRTCVSTISDYNSRAVVVDGRQEADYQGVLQASLRFSPDSKHCAYFADTGRLVAVVLDGERVGDYASLARGGPYFHPDGTLEYLATRGGSLARVKHVP